MSYQCVLCGFVGCRDGDLEKTMEHCPAKNEELQERAKALYLEDDNMAFARTAAQVEGEGYCKLTRIEEIMLFARKAGYHKLGLICCTGLLREARQVHKILSHNGFEGVSVACKNGGIPKAYVGVAPEETVSGCDAEVMCNPIGQALAMNEEKTDLNILLGLCVGHDTLATQYSEAPVTVLAVKDRVLGHNPLAAVYMSEGYYKKKLLK